jgi:NAD(P)-dependent dehydrogenase (short-subunit alcohol dehydrogenase family)
MNQRFVDKIVWITGAGSGIGRALALELARRGADVAVSGRRRDRLDEVVREIEALGRRGLAVPCDVTDEADVARAAQAVVDAFGRLDVCVANAGFGVMGSIEKLSADEWRRQLDTNVVGTAVTARHALPHLRATKGRLALVGSVAGTICAPGSGAYSASKYAVRAIGQTLSMELHGSGVSCTTIQPGFVESEIAKVDNEGKLDLARRDPRPAPLMWKTEAAARVMAEAIWARKREFTFTVHGKLGAFLGMHAPGLVHLVVSRMGNRGTSKRRETPGS